jgi:flagellar protein FliL
MTRKKILIGLLVFLLVGGYAAYSVAMPKKAVHAKINGSIYILPKQFTLNLQDNHYATVTVALVLGAGQSTGSSDASSPPPEGFGALPEEAAIRDIITNILTNQTSATLITTSGRERLKQQILAAITSGTDVKVAGVLFTDVAVQ